jgi:hypothetical protein
MCFSWRPKWRLLPDTLRRIICVERLITPVPPSPRDLEEATYRAFMKDAVAAILIQPTMTNGRVRKAEIAIAVLQWGYGLGAVLAAAWFFKLWER